MAVGKIVRWIMEKSIIQYIVFKLIGDINMRGLKTNQFLEIIMFEPTASL